ncbi:MAG: T9SS type A sorting domain-containing protein, partial [Chlorobi bacterium]|nr:T9SS type A sorting domain-containing protein [Chlorobiota bacterium]
MPTLDPNTPVTEVPPGSGRWRIGPINPPICKCEEVPIIICCYKGPIIWITEDINGGVISIDSTRVDWSTSCPEGSVPPQSKRVRFETPDISQAAGHRLGNPVPNPTSGKVSVPVHIGELPAEHGEARISIYNEGGELLRVIRERVSSQSRRELDLDATGWSNGTYFVRLE